MALPMVSEGRFGIAAPEGFGATAVHAGVKRRKPDLALMRSETPATAVGVFTQNLVRSPVVDVAQDQLGRGEAVEALLVVSGNANACTGPEGYEDTLRLRASVARRLGVRPEAVVVSATGIIGHRWPLERIEQGLERLPVHPPVEDAPLFHEAILTTDHREKSYAGAFPVGDRVVHVGGAAKGSGMIHPNMATTLGFVTTDAQVERAALLDLLREAVDETFNLISVDGDTSTNDMVLVFANGASGVRLSPREEGWEAFRAEFTRCLDTLARAVVTDGEGATTRLKVEVGGAATREEARRAARAVASSNLVKAAMHGHDPNWGRIAAALGRSGARLDPTSLSIAIDGHYYYRHGRVRPGPERIPVQEEIHVYCHLGVGEASATAYGCDLSSEYVRINSRYHT
jgi:glutamate N-acetyltransferase/amino-acid N-acetyltransferase